MNTRSVPSILIQSKKKDIKFKKPNKSYSKTCLNWTLILTFEPANVFGIDMCSVYTGQIENISYIGTFLKVCFIQDWGLVMVRSRRVSLYTEVVIIILVSLMKAYSLKHHFNNR